MGVLLKQFNLSKNMDAIEPSKAVIAITALLILTISRQQFLHRHIPGK